jgi:hypothetical protein
VSQAPVTRAAPPGRSRLPGSPRARAGRLSLAIVWTGWFLTVALALLSVPAGMSLDVVASGQALLATAADISLVTTGAVLASRVPWNPIGWLLWAGGCLLVVGSGWSWALPATVPAAAWLVLAANTVWPAAIVMIGIFIPLLFPTGRLPSRRWRAVVGVTIVCAALATVHIALSPFAPGSAPAGVTNPLAVARPPWALDTANILADLGALVCFPLAAASVAVRYRRASGVERAQLRWLVAAVAFVGPGLAVGVATSGATTGLPLLITNVAWSLALLGLVLLPVAIGVAILRYHLYDIDRIVSRTIAYSTVTVVLAGVFVIGILTLQAVLAPLTGGSTVAVAGSTLLVLALAQPLTRRIRRAVDRRFDRSRYDAERTVAALAARLRDETDLERLDHEIEAAIRSSLAPTRVVIWTRER